MTAGGKQQQHQEGGVVSTATSEPSVARRLWRVARAVLYMLRRGLPSSGRKLAMDLHLLLHRGKTAGKALGDRFLASHSNHTGTAFSFSYAAGGGKGGVGGAFSCGALDPSVAVHEPSRRRREVEFSCSNTPSSTSGGGALGLLGAAARRRRHNRSRQERQQQCEELVEAADGGYLMQQYYSYDAAEVARVFEMLSDEEDDRRVFCDDAAAALVPVLTTTPGGGCSPAQQAQVLRLEAAAAGSSRRQGKKQQQGRVKAVSSSSPADGAAGQVDRRADEFIRRFYEQLRAQRSAASTPDYYGYAASPSPSPSPYGGAPPRAFTAGIA